MIKELPLFPLNLVVFPGEKLNLHIFEPRYKQLINDCLETKSTFGIPSYVLNKIEYGTEVKISEVTKTYEDGRMDIKTTGLGIFKVEDYHNPWEDKEYAGGVIHLQKETEPADPQLTQHIAELSSELFDWLQMTDEIQVTPQTKLCEIIHKIGLKPDEEYRLITMSSAKERQLYVIEHLEKLLPALERAEHAREKIQMNGHFKNFDPLNF